MPDISYVPISTLRQDVKSLAERFLRSKTYDNALALQKASRELEAFFKNERRDFLVFSNTNVRDTRSDYVAPSSFRVIDGGRDGPF